jgi:hypothetical protein
MASITKALVRAMFRCFSANREAGRNGDELPFCALIKRTPKASASRNSIMFSVV